MWRQNPLPPNCHTIRNQILQRDNYTCQHCGSHQNLEVDHIIPAWKLGWDNHNPNNLQTLCRRCHTQKTQYERITYTHQKPHQQTTRCPCFTLFRWSDNNHHLYPKGTSLNPNRSLDRYGAISYREYNFLPSFIFLLASCFSFVLAVARYAFELTVNNLLNNLMKSVQALMTD